MRASAILPLLTTLLFFFAAPALADTQITSLTADPDVVNPYTQETTTITVLATPGVNTLVVRVLTSDGGTVVHEGLPLAETSEGAYTVVWDGKSTSGYMVMAGEYQLRVYNLATTTFMGPSRAITVAGLGYDAPTSFVPTGSNAITFTLQAAPGQTGLKLRFYNYYAGGYYGWYGPDGTIYLSLTETSSPGVYTAEWNAVRYSQKYVDGQYQWFPDYIMQDATYTIYVQDSASSLSDFLSARW